MLNYTIFTNFKNIIFGMSIFKNVIINWLFKKILLIKKFLNA